MTILVMELTRRTGHSQIAGMDPSRAYDSGVVNVMQARFSRTAIESKEWTRLFPGDALML